MSDWIKRRLLRLFRVPPEPAPPAGSPESIRVFLAGRNYFRWRIAKWTMLQLAILLGLLAIVILPPPMRSTTQRWVVTSRYWIEAVALAGFAASLPLTYFKQRLDYEMRWYIVTDRSLRIRDGIWSVEEQTMTFANIQHIRVTAGPLQYLFGLADVEVSTAGGGSGGQGAAKAHVAHFLGVDNAEEIRDLIVERLRLYRDSGLGDSELRSDSHSADARAAQAALAVLVEARALRASIAKSFAS